MESFKNTFNEITNDEKLASELANKTIEYFSDMNKDAPTLTEVALFLSDEEIKQIVEEITKNEKWIEITQNPNKSEKIIEKIMDEHIFTSCSPDVALFGRMIANKQKWNVDAACQMAHAISTNKIEQEMDYFIAMDDLKPVEMQGANMIGDITYNSSCFYRFANINIDQLKNNLNNDNELTTNTLMAFIDANIKALPLAKQNSFAAFELPSLVMTIIKESRSPTSLMNAFVKPISPKRDSSIEEESIDALLNYKDKLNHMY